MTCQARWWVMRIESWGVRFIPAEAPCWNGEIHIGPIVVGWHRRSRQAQER